MEKLQAISRKLQAFDCLLLTTHRLGNHPPR
jgi:hypothetical protein